MAFTPQLLGKASGTNLTTLNVNTSGVFAAGGRIYVVVAMNDWGPDDCTDSVGNVYEQAGGSQNSGISTTLLQCINNIRVPNNGTITITAPAGWSGSMGVFGVSGLTSGELHQVGAGQGSDNLPLVALDNVAANDWVMALAGVQAASTNAFTQGAGFSNPGNFNVQTTTVFSTYAGIVQTAGGSVVWRPSLASPALWAAVMISIAG